MKKIKSYLVPFIILPLVLLFLTELVQRASLFSVLTWPVLHLPEFLVSFMLVFCFLSIIWALTNNLRLSFFVVLIVSLLFALISNIKQKFLGEPLLPWDFVLGKETTDIINYFSSFINTKVILFIVFIILLGVFLFRYLPLKKGNSVYKCGVKKRVVLFVLAVVLISSICTNYPISFKKSLGLECITWDQKLNARQNGLMLAFCNNLQWLSIEEPEGYNEARIAEIVNNYLGTESELPVVGSASVKPNIIVIMNEAFWDPCLLPGVSFNRDPLPFIHALQKKHTAGSLLVPVFGGATVNTEFEVLTGHSTQFLPGGSIAYAQYVRKPVESLASILAEQGYKTTALHSYHNWFYRRDEVFRNFGFANFISSEFFVEPELKRYYISDAEVSQLLIEESKESKEPFFVFAVTMQNHGPYGVGYGEETRIKVEGDLSPESKYILENYAQGVADADKSLQMLVEYFQKSEQPTIIVFFGDHLPALGEDYQVYRETNFYQENRSYEEYQKMHTVPFILWSNYLPHEAEVKLNASFLGPYLLHRAGLSGSFYTDYLFSLWQKAPLIPKQTYYPKVGIKKGSLTEYQLLQYDLLFGKNYLYQGERPSIVQEEYFLGRKKMEIKSVRLLEEKKALRSKWELEITGKNFVPGCRVYLKDKPLTTNFVDESHLKVVVSERIFKQLDKLTIQVKLTDSLRNIIATSNCAMLGKMLK
ncbi:MAG TPA: sulfatase-like hydrolase/transferase [Clostridia bacterium]|jgi:phosphoglycerol transferase MdoB-like AlkP superfamily enzyme|nr:LTA synthase family protein [Clostridia bacterium]HHY05792.1 sulfatase-like hydrolase/transferase [Clostridia bacterium]